MKIQVFIHSISFSSASRMLLWRLKGKAATPDRLQLKCQFEHHMNLIACFKSLKQLGPKLIERLELQESIKYWQIALHCACTLRRAWVDTRQKSLRFEAMRSRSMDGVVSGNGTVWPICSRSSSEVPTSPWKASAPASMLDYKPLAHHGRNFTKKHKTPRLCLKKSLGLEPKQAKLLVPSEIY